jgi:aryl-alcohol dehydrogenase-like predicted oxidoreductase
MRLCLGTVQFGLNYGINNNRGKLSRDDITEILNFAYDNSITLLDTASAYGDSESAIGESLNRLNKQFQIVTKYPANQRIRPIDWIDTSLQRLKADRVYGYLFHNYSLFDENQNLINDFVKIKDQGKASKIGFSLYYPSEAEYILKNNIPCDIVQIPYNIFDQRFEKIFPDLKKRRIEIHIRSVFLQGLFFINPSNIDEHFAGIKPLLHELAFISQKEQLDISGLCLGFVNSNKYIDKIIIGVDSLDNLKENICNYHKLSNMPINYQQFTSFSVTDENIILPFNWKNEDGT